MSTRTIAYAAAAGAGALVMGSMALILLMGGAGSSDSAGTAGSCSSATVSAAGQPPLTRYYLGAASRFELGASGYAYLAAINMVETSFGTNIAVSSAGAVGWMQFEPATFRQYGVSVSNPAAPADPDDPQDAIYTAANMLHANGAPGNWNRAILAYNHAGWYVQQVERTAGRFMGPDGLRNLADAVRQAWDGGQPPASDQPIAVDRSGSDAALSGACGTIASSEPLDVQPVPGRQAVIMPSGLARPPADAPTAVQAMIDAGDRITGFDYQWGGGHGDPSQSDSLSDPDPQGGTQPGLNGTPGYDCSGATDYVLWGGGYGQSLLDGGDPASGELMDVGQPGQGSWVTWWAQSGHVFISVAGIVLDTVHGYPVAPGNPSTGPRWQPEGEVGYELQSDGTFLPRHPQGL